jgi:transcriptional regulator with XRE-family HTH domain
LLAELGERLRRARLRRSLTAAEVASQAGITRVTLHRLERGEPAVTIATLLKVMAGLGMSPDFALLARDAGVAAGSPPHTEPGRPTRSASAPRRVRLARYPQLARLAWQLSPSVRELDAAEAFALYERGWRHLDLESMEPHERALLKRLTASVGKGVLLV